jgi:hypothetical protein
MVASVIHVSIVLILTLFQSTTAAVVADSSATDTTHGRESDRPPTRAREASTGTSVSLIQS